uniref:Uncharacterized protein n=1 Tax=Anguilla anguilla TaxID=7936 RepID=A0A0E9WD46_ANGAN
MTFFIQLLILAGFMKTNACPFHDKQELPQQRKIMDLWT